MFKRHVLSIVPNKNAVLALLCSACSLHAVAESSVANSGANLYASNQIDSVPSHAKLMYQANSEGSTLLHFQPNTASVYSQRLVLSADATVSHIQLYVDGPANAMLRVVIYCNSSGALVGEGPNSVPLVDANISKAHDGLEWVTLAFDNELSLAAGQVFISVEPLSPEVSWQLFSSKRKPYCEAPFEFQGAVQTYSGQILLSAQENQTLASVEHYDREFAFKLFGQHSQVWIDHYNAADIVISDSLRNLDWYQSQEKGNTQTRRFWTQIPKYVGVFDYNKDGFFDVVTSTSKFVSRADEAGNVTEWEAAPLFANASTNGQNYCVSSIPLLNSEGAPHPSSGLLVYSESKSTLEVYETGSAGLQYRCTLFESKEQPNRVLALRQQQAVIVTLIFSNNIVSLEVDATSLDVQKVRKISQSFQSVIPVSIESEVYLAGIESSGSMMWILEQNSLEPVSSTKISSEIDESEEPSNGLTEFVLTQLADGRIYAIESIAPSMNESPQVFSIRNLLDNNSSRAEVVAEGEFENPLWLIESVQSHSVSLTSVGSAAPEVVLNSSCSCISPRYATSPFKSGDVLSALALQETETSEDHKVFKYDLNLDGIDDILSLTSTSLEILLADKSLGEGHFSMSIVDESFEGLTEVTAYDAGNEIQANLGSYTHPRYETPVSVTLRMPNEDRNAEQFIDSIRVVGQNIEQTLIGPYPSGIYTYKAGALHKVEGANEVEPSTLEVDVDLFPQPAQSFVQFDVISQGSERAFIEIFDVQGVSLHSQEFQLFNGNGQFVWNLPSTIANGTFAYSIRVGRSAESEFTSVYSGVFVVQK